MCLAPRTLRDGRQFKSLPLRAEQTAGRKTI